MYFGTMVPIPLEQVDKLILDVRSMMILIVRQVLIQEKTYLIVLLVV